VDSTWFKGAANIITYEMDELIATKLRALYRRRKGRDLFDVWYVADRKLINLDQVFDIFYQYCSYNDVKLTGEDCLKNLELKKDHRDFHMDMSVLLPSKLHCNFDEAYQFVVDNVISRLP
jgi:predicted nucleotidyltransferase component of viral defense system